MTEPSYIDLFYPERFISLEGNVVSDIEPFSTLVAHVQHDLVRWMIFWDARTSLQLFGVSKDGLAMLQDRMEVDAGERSVVEVEAKRRLPSESSDPEWSKCPFLVYSDSRYSYKHQCNYRYGVFWNGHSRFIAGTDLPAAEALFASQGDQLACLIIEPITGNMNMILPKPGYLEALRALCDAHGVVLIFDEVMTGFRVAKGGAQALIGVTPDLTCLGKIIGGGMPVGAFGGRTDIMDMLAPIGPVYQAGTLSGNPVAMAAGLATLALLDQPMFYEQLSASTEGFVTGMVAAAHAAGIPMQGVSRGGMFGLFFAEHPVTSFAEVTACDEDVFKRFFHLMLDRGIYLAPSMYEAGFVSSTHTEAVIERTLTAAKASFQAL